MRMDLRARANNAVDNRSAQLQPEHFQAHYNELTKYAL